MKPANACASSPAKINSRSPSASAGRTLASKLTGWQVDIEAEHVVTKGFEEKVAEAIESLAAVPGITREQAEVLVNNGLRRLEELLQAEESDLAGIPEIGDQASAIMEAARAEAAKRTLKVGETPVSS